MRTPGHDAELAAGFLLGEGLLGSRAELLAIDATPDPNVLVVRLRAGVQLQPALTERHFYRSSSCGVCGKASIAALQAVPMVRAVAHGRVPFAGVTAMAARLKALQPGFALTGGLHAAALFQFDGNLVAVREDVGRHNALDKLVGAQWLAGRLPLADHVLVLSGRASFELLQKAMAAGIPVVAAVGAPSSLAIDLAHAAGITLLGFVREGGGNVYAHGARLEEVPAA
jgi:FdhD protein